MTAQLTTHKHNHISSSSYFIKAELQIKADPPSILLEVGSLSLALEVGSLNPASESVSFPSGIRGRAPAEKNQGAFAQQFCQHLTSGLQICPLYF